MQAHKVHNKSVLRVITYYPNTVKEMCNSFPGISVKTEFESINSGDKPNEHFIWVRCPNPESTSALGNLLRKIKLEEIQPNED
jgi:hypothetical protein